MDKIAGAKTSRNRALSHDVVDITNSLESDSSSDSRASLDLKLLHFARRRDSDDGSDSDFDKVEVDWSLIQNGFVHIRDLVACQHPNPRQDVGSVSIIREITSVAVRTG